METSNVCNKLQTFNLKKDERHLRKKRKLQAFLELVEKDKSTSLEGAKKVRTIIQESYKVLKDKVKEYQKKKCDEPSFYLSDDGKLAEVTFSVDGKISNCISPLFFEDIHHLLLASVLGNLSLYRARWAKLRCAQRVCKTVLIEIEGLSQQNVVEIRAKLIQNCFIFPHVTELISSNIPFATELCTLHLPTNFHDRTEGSYSSVFPMNETPVTQSPKSNPQKNFSKLHLLLSPVQLAMEHYPLPQSIFEQSKSDDYCFTKDTYNPVHENSPMYALDCEMCRTVSGRHDVTRIAIVNENLETVYHTLVKPKEKIIDYVTKFSGITEEMLRNVTTTLTDVQQDIRRILPSDAILCGQSLNFDLHALKMTHPYIIDTSIIFNENRIRQKKTSLKQLACIHLKESIQNGKNGHNPVEDSIATMKLVQLKLKQFVEYGDAVLSSEVTESNVSISEDKDSTSSAINETYKFPNGFFSLISRHSKKVCLVGPGDTLSNYSADIIIGNVTQVIKSEVRKIFKAVADNVKSNDLILSHLVLDLENYSITNLCDEMKQMYDSFPSNTLFVVLMADVNKLSDENFKHNYCMVSLKKGILVQ